MRHLEDDVRIDQVEKVTGGAKYVEDLPALPGTCYAAALRSPYAHARILAIDSSRAKRLHGVLAVLDREHLEGLNPRVEVGDHGWECGRGTADRGLITTDKVRFDGDLLGMVVAEDLWTARRAIELIEVEYEMLPPVFSYQEAFAAGAPLVHEDLGSNLACVDSFEWGDVERGFAEADQIFEEMFSSAGIFHYPIEPATSFVVHFRRDTVEVWAPIHTASSTALRISKLFGIRVENVHLRVPYIGGSFGAKHLAPEIMTVLELSRRVGRPVKFVASAADSFRANAGHPIAYKAKVGVKSGGSLVALDVALEIDTGAYFTGAAVVAHEACILSWGGYRVPHYRAQARVAYTNKVPAAYFRGTGKRQVTFGIECTMDSIARKMGIDPIEFRKKNILLPGERPADVWRVRGEPFAANVPALDSDCIDLLRRAVDAIETGGQTNQTGASGPEGSLARGRGVAVSFRHNASGYGGRSYAAATVDHDGLVRISHNAAELGQGSYTVIRTVASRALGIPASQVEVGAADTGNELYFVGTHSQRTTVEMGNAVLAACEALKRELIEVAVQAYGGTREEWRVSNGRLWRGEENHSFADVVRVYEGGGPLKALGSYSYPPTTDKAFGGFVHWAVGAAAAEVEVDVETGEVRVLQYAAVADAGKALHYSSARGQVEGGAIMGLGIALFEELRYEDGQFQNGDPFQYRLPHLGDLPKSFHAVIVENGDGPGPFGSKGMAQTSIPCVPPAINNAICDAIGVHLKSTPFTPEKILHALGKLKRCG